MPEVNADTDKSNIVRISISAEKNRFHIVGREIQIG